MKKLYKILAALLITASTFAQAPDKMSYQAVVRDSDDVLVSNQTVGMQISILQATDSGTEVYVETQTPTTNINGLVTLEIGSGTVINGDFTTIDWSIDNYFIKSEIDPTGGSDYTITGTSQLLSVPYSLYARTAENVTNSIWTTISDDYHQINFANNDNAQIKGDGNTDLSGNDFEVGDGVFWGTNPGEDTGMFTDGDQLIFISPGDNQLVQFWEEDSHQIVAQISSNGAYSQVSDESLKQNIRTIDNALEKTLNISGYTYEFKQSKEDIKKGTPAELSMGILAQELKAIAPELVTLTKQGHFVVNYDGIVPILIEATKEQQVIINDLKAEIEEIKSMLSRR